MRLPEIAIKNHQFTTIIVLLLVLSGIVSFVQMPRSEDPPVAKPGTTVIVVYPGATPADMEELVVSPIEESLNELEDIKRLESRCEDGLATINIEFIAGSDPDEKYSDVNEKVNAVRNDLPKDILRLMTKKWSIEDTAFLQVALCADASPSASGEMDYSEMEKYADRLKKKLEKIKGIRKVKTWAFPEQEVRVEVDLEKAAQLGISLNRLMGAVQAANMNIPGGSIDTGGKRFNIQTSGSYNSIEEIKNTIVHSSGTEVVYLKDVADVFMGYEDSNYYARFNGKKSVFVSASQKDKTNIFDIVKNVKEKIGEFEQNLPRGLKLYYVFDQSESVDERISDFFSNLLQGVVLVGVVILLAVGLQGSIIVMLAIPISLFIALGFVDISGYGLQQMSITGLVITLGLLVDNAIVVVENITRFIKMGESKTDAAIKGTSQIAWAIVSATATTVLAFIPIVMMQDVSGEYIRSMPLTVIYTLTVSLFVALTFTPYLSTKILKQQRREGRVEQFFSRFITTRYRSWLDFALRKPGLIILLSLAVLIGSMGLFPLVGVSFFPKAEKPLFFVNVSTPDGTNIDRTNEVVRDVEKVLRERLEVRDISANVGHTNPQIYYNIIERQNDSTLGHLFVKLEQDVSMDRMRELIGVLRAEFKDYPGAKIEVKELEQGPPVQAPVEIKILGEELGVIKKIAGDIEKIFSQTPGLININNPLDTSKTDIEVSINREAAALMGLPLAEIDRVIRMSVEGLTVSTYRDMEGKDYNIVFRLPGDAARPKARLDVFDKIYLTSALGTQVPLSQVASLRLKSGPVQVRHFNMERSTDLTADVSGEYTVNEVTRQLLHRLEAYQWPEGYSYFVGGEQKAQQESFGGMGRAVIIAIIAIFAVLVLQFRSFSQPLIVFAALPLAIIGSILALLFTGNTFSFTAFIGVTSLVGIVVNNSIILVDYTNQLRAEGKRILESLKEASETRFMPIILTTGTTIGGLLPLTIRGGTLWAPLGWTIIGGLLTSTLLTLIVVPVLYKIFTKEN
jgi:multidrug efflux pump subunit AcrB